jgi:hypothetical protein
MSSQKNVGKRISRIMMQVCPGPFHHTSALRDPVDCIPGHTFLLSSPGKV